MSIIILGYNRSGTTVISEAIKEILNNRKVKLPVDETQKNKFDKFFNKFKEISSHLNLNFQSYSLVKYKRIDMLSSGYNKFLYINNIKFQKANTEQVLRLYAKPNKIMVDYLTKQKHKCFLIVRNPLDILVSNAFEIENFTEIMYPKLFTNINFNQTRLKYGNYYLNNKLWVNETLNKISNYYTLAIKHQRKLNFIKYEDLLINGPEVIRGISKKIDHLIALSQSKKIWNKVGNKNLKSYKTHFFKPSIHKYRTYLSQDLINQVLLNKKFKFLSEYFKYYFENSLKVNKSFNFKPDVNNLILIRNLLQEKQFDIKIPNQLDKFFVSQFKINNDFINMYSNDMNVLKNFKERSPYLFLK